MNRSVLITALVFMAIGCAGAVDRVGKDGSNGGSSGSSGSSGGGDPEGDVVPGSCNIEPLDGTRACVPGLAKANAPITIKMETTGCSSTCGGTFTEPCEVSVSGDVVTLKASVKRCQLKEPKPCPAVCEVPQIDCTIPPLAAGSYRVKLVGEIVNSESAPRQLVVAANGDASSCTFPNNGTPPPIVASDYANTCTSANDCLAVVTGDVCGVCQCPNAAIAKSSSEKYEADVRASQSVCRSEGTASCAPCETTTPACVNGKCVLN